MSLLNKFGLEKLSAYNDLQHLFNMQHAHILKLESEIINLRDKMENMSETPVLRQKLDDLHQRYQTMKEEFELDDA